MHDEHRCEHATAHRSAMSEGCPADACPHCEAFEPASTPAESGSPVGDLAGLAELDLGPVQFMFPGLPLPCPRGFAFLAGQDTGVDFIDVILNHFGYTRRAIMGLDKGRCNAHLNKVADAFYDWTSAMRANPSVPAVVKGKCIVLAKQVHDYFRCQGRAGDGTDIMNFIVAKC